MLIEVIKEIIKIRVLGFMKHLEHFMGHCEAINEYMNI